MKENVIIGKLVPAGTGMSLYRDIDVRAEGESTAMSDAFDAAFAKSSELIG